jgi:hypothetical protein
MRLINADALKESLKKLKAEGDNRKYVQGLQDAIDDYFPQIIDDEPTIDAEPVRHGRWIRGTSKGWPTSPSCLWYCSCCGEKIRYVDTLRTYQKIKKPVNEVNPYCRKCGAKMDRGDCNEKT